ncbi:MAG: efflux RND transporter permease subunit [Synergistetes bacterium]|nr:efflux RND transporter permease subunit [Synergistota bacterium]MCX8128028.1 efflux RND transporter permease subunit [Synergistota bacterium]MDW8193066.1 efflux RND transporter permease subunit [Synergistota bacterium]
MLKLVRFSVNRPVTVLMIFFGVLVLGIFSLIHLRIDLLPEIEQPVINVMTTWSGASAADVESEITKVMEDYLSTISGLDELQSRSLDGISIVTCIFKWGRDLSDATNDIRDQIERVKRFLPEDADDPRILKFSTTMSPVLILVFTASENYYQLYRIVDKYVRDAVERVPGVGTTSVMGGLERQINVILDLVKLEAYNISLSQVKNALRMSNVTIPAGTIEVGVREFNLRIPGKYNSIDEIANTVVGAYGGRPIYLKDIAKVEDGFADENVKSFGNGKRSVILVVRKQTDANTVEVANGVKSKLPYIKTLLPKDADVYIAIDSSEFIVLAIKSLVITLLQGLGLVMLITLLFLRRFGATLTIGLSIPFSLIITFILMFGGKYTINLISLSSLAIASGMVVDNSIVVLENITRYMERGVKPFVAATVGTAEVGAAVLASTLTTLAVFVPLMFITGFSGVMFKQLAFVMSAAVGASLFIALTLIPSVAARRLKSEIKKGIFYKFGERALVALERFYKVLLSLALRVRWFVVAMAVLGLVFTGFLFKHIGLEFVSSADMGEVRVTFYLPEGTSIKAAEDYMMKVVKFIEERIPEKVSYYSRCGSGGQGVLFGSRAGSNVVEVGVKLVSKTKRNRSDREIARVIRGYLRSLPGIESISVRTSTFLTSMLSGVRGGSSLQIDIAGDDLDVLRNVANQVKQIVETVKGVVDVSISQGEPRPELWIEVDREKASLLGVNMSLLGDTIRTYFEGTSPTSYSEGGEEYDIVLRLREDQRNNLELLSQLPILTSTGNLIKLGSIAKVERRLGPMEITRKERMRVFTIDASVIDKAISEVEREIKEKLSKEELPTGVNIFFRGEIKQMKETYADLLKVLALGIMLVYMVMASQFEAFLDPLVIMFSVPFAFTGVALGLYMFKQPLSTHAFLGIIMLVGIVVNNAIVLVDYTNLMRARGYRLFEAVLETGVRRLRPVLMTTLTTVGGMIPMLVSRGEGAEIWKPLAAVIIAGLSFSTLVTLILIPVVYTIVEQYLRRKKRFVESGEAEILERAMGETEEILPRSL